MSDLAALETLVSVADARGLTVLLIGALAREIIFDQLVEGKPYRATRDVDMSVRVPGWDAYHDFINALEQAGFTKLAEHKLRHRDGTEIDLLPFGAVVDDNQKLTWQGGRVMSMDGFESANAHGEPRDLGSLTLRVVNLPGLVTLKLFAFKDRGQDTRSSDLSDLGYILTNATDVLGERVYNELEPELLEDLDYDELGPHLLGRDVASIVQSDERDRLNDIVLSRILTSDYMALSRAVSTAELPRAARCFKAFAGGLRRGIG